MTGDVKGARMMDERTSEAHRRRAKALLAIVTAITAAVTAAHAQDQNGPPSQKQNDTELQEIVVTGSRIARDGFDASTPVTVLDAVDLKTTGTVNVEDVLSDAPQFIGSTNGGATANTVPGGTADVNLRGFGASRNLVLVNGRRFAIYGPEQVTDLNTIPTALIARTEVVTGGSSAVYGSDAITGVVNFILRDDFEGVEATYQGGYDSPTNTPTHNADLTAGRNFADGRGNAVISFNYLDRGAITRRERGEWAFFSLTDGCVTPASASETAPGVPVSVPTGSTCRGVGGVPGLIAGGSAAIPNGRFSGIPLPGSRGSTADLENALIAAGISGMDSRGFTVDETGLNARPFVSPQDQFNIGPDNYLQVPQERRMVNAFTHYDFTDKATGYVELHFSRNTVDQQLAPTDINGPFLFAIDSPYLGPAMREVLRQADLAETAPSTVVTGTTSRINNPGDGLAMLSVARRLVEVGLRRNVSERDVWRGAAGFRGELGDVSTSFLRDLAYDAYYSYARTEETSQQSGNVARSRFQEALLSSGGADPVLNIFGPNISPAAVDAIAIDAINVTEADLQVAAATISGEAFDIPTGTVDFSLGVEWRYASADFVPDAFLSSGDVVGFNPGQPTGGSVTAREVFGEVRVPLLGDRAWVQSLAANGGFRFSDYDLDGVGGVWTYLYGADWRVNPDFAFRGQFQRAIRAPNVSDLFGGTRRSVEGALDPCSSRQPATGQTEAVRQLCIQSGVPADLVWSAGVQPNDIVEGLFGGNPDLSEESSDTYTFGVVVTPDRVPNLAVSLDYFDIDVQGAIAQLGGGLNNTLNLCYNIIRDIKSEFCQAIARNPATGAIGNPFYAQIRQANTGALETSGIDLQARYRFEMDWGLPGLDSTSSFELSTSWTYTDEFTTTPVQALPDIQNECVGAYGTTCGEPIPELKGVSRLTWNTGPASLTLRHRFIDEVTVDRHLLPKRAGNPFPALQDLTNPTLDAQHYLDLSFIYGFREKYQFFGGVKNILKNEPPVVGSAQVRANTWPATYDYNGREVFLGVTANLF
jgi:outer membrane receptor protein involved in Fe transport